MGKLEEFLRIWTRTRILRKAYAGPGLVDAIATVLEKDGMALNP